jgi:hypothetical protein
MTTPENRNLNPTATNQLIRIELNALLDLLQSIAIPSLVQSIDGLAFCHVNLLNSISRADFIGLFNQVRELNICFGEHFSV